MAAGCHAGMDGDCDWDQCPQEADNRANYQPWCVLADSEADLVPTRFESES